MQTLSGPLDLVTHGLHLVYTWSTPCLHLVYNLQPCSMFIQTNQMASDCRKALLPRPKQALHVFLEQITASLLFGSTQHHNVHMLPTTHGSYGCGHTSKQSLLQSCWHVCIRCKREATPHTSMVLGLCVQCVLVPHITLPTVGIMDMQLMIVQARCLQHNTYHPS